MSFLDSLILPSSGWDRCSSSDASARRAVVQRARPRGWIVAPCPVSRAQRRTARPRTCRGRDVGMRCSAGTSFNEYPWLEREYHKVSLQAVSQQAYMTGTLILSRDDQRGAAGAEAMCITVGGDTFQGIVMMMSRMSIQRPLSLDLLWQILERGHEISKRDWRLIRVAVVDLEGTVFLGRAPMRLFFGDNDGSTVWDCDCRPSDGLWLALKSKCPIYVKKTVWANSATTVERLLSGSAEPDDEDETTSTRALTTIRGDEPDPIKRLKREMAVALQEEDYKTAARLRDHPFLQAHLRIRQLLREGRGEAASAMELELGRLIDAQQAPDCAD